MWANLTDDVRKAIDAAGEVPVASYEKSWWGTVTLTARGRGLDPGKVTVTGCDVADQAYFKEAFRRVSKKAVKYE